MDSLKILDITENPIEVISQAAGVCYGKSDISEKRVKNCIKSGHLSVLEHAKFTIRVGGISRACSHQLVRHRLASYCQQSQRYYKIDTSSDDWYVTPINLEGITVFNNLEESDIFKNAMRECAKNYTDAVNHGIKPEDARYMLPEACKTEIVISMNLREFWHTFILRTDKSAQFEIHELFDCIFNLLSEYNKEWCDILEWLDNIGKEN